MINLDVGIIKTNCLGIFEENKISLRFDLVTYFFTLIPTMFVLDPEIIKTNILSKFEKIGSKLRPVEC